MGHRLARATAMLLMPLLGLGAQAWAGDATFLTSSTISVQGVPNIPADFTIECRVWIPANAEPILPGSASTYPGGAVFTAQRDSAMHTAMNIGRDGVAIKGTTAYYERLACSLPTDRWCHVAVVRQGASMGVYVDGARVGTIACSAGAQAIASNADVRIGAPVQNGGGLPTKGFAGRIDWVRVSSVARYGANFAPPREFDLVPADASTELLLCLNDRWPSATVVDESPRGFTTVVGDGRSFAPGAATPPYLSGFGCASDLDTDGEVSASDISILLLDFGPCP